MPAKSNPKSKKLNDESKLQLNAVIKRCLTCKKPLPPGVKSYCDEKCREVRREWRHNYYERHKAEILKQSEAYRKSHLEQFREYRKEAYHKDIEASRYKERCRGDYKVNWSRNNKAKLNQQH